MKKLQDWVDRVSTLISSLMIAAMMLILVVNIIARLIPKIGGVTWYMESSQYLNVWAMVIIGIQITIKGTHLRVEVVDALTRRSPMGQKLVKVIDSAFIILFYVLAAYAGFLLATKAKQAVSTMPMFNMGQVYAMMPVAYALSAVAAVVDLVVWFKEYGKSSGEDKPAGAAAGAVDEKGGNEA